MPINTIHHRIKDATHISCSRAKSILNFIIEFCSYIFESLGLPHIPRLKESGMFPNWEKHEHYDSTTKRANIK